jgi:hypothetical protein
MVLLSCRAVRDELPWWTPAEADAVDLAFLSWPGAGEGARLGQTGADKDDAARGSDDSHKFSTVRHGVQCYIDRRSGA